MERSEESTTVPGLTKGRIEALTDGIFAFAMTLLVTSMELPVKSHPVVTQHAQEILTGLYPDFVHYVIAFVTLAGFWVWHHTQYHSIRFIDRRLLWINIASLMFVALVPFSTSLAGDYPEDTLAAIVLQANLLVIGVLFYWQWSYASKDYRLISRSIDKARIELGKKRCLVVPSVSVLAMLLSVLNFSWSSAIYLAVPIILAVIRS